jgi:clan AA aspartic protease
MGHVVVEAELAGARRQRVRLLVDTGATYTVLPADLARRLEITEAPRRLRVRLADGRTKSMRVGTVFVRLLGREAASTALIGAPGLEPLLGVEALEALGLTVDPRSRSLKPTRAHAVMLVSIRGAYV